MAEAGRYGVCYLCSRPATCVDHCHETGLIRGYLCGRHNMLAGQREEILKVLAYVDASPIGEPYSEFSRRRRKTNYKDKERESYRIWQHKNREHVNELNRKWRERNRVAYNARAMEHYWRRKTEKDTAK